MKYDFVEIGTSNFDTLIEQASSTTVGLSIEPIKHYLDALPEKPNVKKINCAVSANNCREILQVFYVPEQVIVDNRLPDWLRGCNSVGDYHKQHRRLEITDLVKKQYVPCYPIHDIFLENNITELDFLKIDTEGADCDIMLGLYDFLLTQERSVYPGQIQFESNELANTEKVALVKSKFIDLGYSVVDKGTDTLLLLDKPNT